MARANHGGEMKMSDNQTVYNSSGGIGFTGALTIAFIVLKLTGVIDWSWWWVLSPLWIGFLLFIGLMLILGVILLIVLWRSED